MPGPRRFRARRAGRWARRLWRRQNSPFDGVFEDIFEKMFGRFGKAERGKATGEGEALRMQAQISLEEAFVGLKTTICIPTSVTGKACRSTERKEVPSPACRSAGPAASIARRTPSRASF